MNSVHEQHEDQHSHIIISMDTQLSEYAVSVQLDMPLFNEGC
jgi:hypothetical protein